MAAHKEVNHTLANIRWRTFTWDREILIIEDKDPFLPNKDSEEYQKLN